MQYFQRIIVVLILGLAWFPVTESGAAESKGRAILVLDSSGSMWGQINNRTKIEIAREVVGNLMADWDPAIELGLVAYGHRRKGDCGDIETLIPVGPVDAASIQVAIKKINPKGKTPLSAAVLQAAKDLRFTEERATVILVSDGKETCDMDPCALGRELEAQGVEFTTHVVSFDVAAEDQAQLKCLAENTGGRFLTADTATELKEALTEVVEIATAPEPEPEPEPAEPSVYFEDNFDGEVLAEHWDVVNADSDAFIVEDGMLLVVGSGVSALDSSKSENVFRLQQPLPKGDWVATMKFSMDYQTGYEVPYLALYDSKSDYIASFAYADSKHEAIRGPRLFLGGQKMAKGEKKDFNRHIWGSGSSDVPPFTSDMPPNPILLRLTKNGRSYTPAVKLEGIENAEWIEHEKFTTLRQKGGLAVGVYLWQAGTETAMYIDWVKIEALP